MQKSRIPSFVAGAVVALVLGSGTAFAATGGKLILGHSNSANRTTTLSNSRGTALALSSKSGTPALKVNSRTKVANLNADQLDGLSSASFARTTGKTGAFDSTGVLGDSDGNGLDDFIVAEATCPAGTQMTGGGIADFTTTGFQVLNAPDTDESWIVADVIDENTTEDPTSLTASVVCYSPTGTGLAGSYGLARQTEQPVSAAAYAIAKKAALSHLAR